MDNQSFIKQLQGYEDVLSFEKRGKKGQKNSFYNSVDSVKKKLELMVNKWDCTTDSN